EHGTRRVANDALGNRAEQRVTQAGVAVRADDDEIDRLVLARKLDDLVPRRAGEQLRGHADDAGLIGGALPFIERLASLLLVALDEREGELRSGVRVADRLPDMHEDQLGARGRGFLARRD